MTLILSGLAALLGGGLLVVGARAATLQRRLRRADEELSTVQHRLPATESALLALRSDVQVARATIADLDQRIEAARRDDEQKVVWLNSQQQEIDFLRAQLAERPRITRKKYKIITVGVKWSGKTSLTLKWANPLIDLGTLQGTKIERYERTVSQVAAKEHATEHVFEIGDWGGEHIVNALHELIMDEVHGMLIVVDLGGKDAKSVDPARIQEQLLEFQPQSLQYFFGPKTVASCKTVVLFINKSDLLPGTPADVEAKAKQLYAKLILDLSRYQEKVDIRVLVGSASYGHSTHLLFSHFVEKILPKNAYDNQLLQRLKADLPAPPDPPAGGPRGGKAGKGKA